ncbi:unnamed protein product, partial [Urochloa humidicola]
EEGTCKSVNGLPLQTSSQLIWLAMLADLLLSTTEMGVKAVGCPGLS